jgi:predicted Zn-dependent protease with MMP-like domain
VIPDWEKLVALAQDEVRRTLAALPADLRAAARALPVTFEPMPNAALIEEGLDADTLGLFVGGDHDLEEHSLIPSQIILYLENIWLMIADEGGQEAEYRGEVRTTLLHELGHYLGLDEDELTERGLE